jgi:D-glycero-D-manno-heptose 1,7-bisphosphate phosphatase
MQLRPALFLDRDGVLIENRPDYVRVLDHVIFIPGALEALARFHQHRPEWRIIVVSNQAGIGRGLIAPDTAEAINAEVRRRVAESGGHINAIYICPHRAAEDCDCRKPKPGLLLQAAREWGLDLAGSVMVGDSATDVMAARAAGVRPIFVRTGLPERLADEQAAAAHLQAAVHRNLSEAVAQLLDHSHTNAPN